MSIETAQTGINDRGRAALDAAKLRFYEIPASKMSPTGRALLEGYSKIPPDEVDKHADEIVRNISITR
jgi:hypothetical protein